MPRKTKSEWEQQATLRKDRGLKQEQMARIMGVSLITYKRWETNAFSPDYETPGRADYFHVSTDYLLGRATPSQLTQADRENLAATPRPSPTSWPRPKYRIVKMAMKTGSKKTNK